ncbi:glycerate kinase [Sporosarcina sp. ACRSM]|uniref:glycerate kinase n=1 Tax=Sporosarcina sp. ACRSM TaxID=2918216 RepID=UPI001EF5598A|nr:glycerate kinase [Sporosarcina sp. ACRSM]MCG7336089.1 glycerate kinase [Sporosarcina sp. ACRSM]
MKMIVAPDSFKGSLTAVEAAEAMAAGVRDYDATITTVLLPAADGGEGTMHSLVGATQGKEVTCAVQDPLGRTIEANYGVLGDGVTCVVEIAEASGLTLLHEDERNPLVTSSYGTGELIRHALAAGFRKFIIGLGGSATNDAGAGMLQALGMKFLSREGVELNPGGGALNELHTMDSSHFDKRIAESHFLIASDVKNPFVGPTGASAVFGPQKGATPAMVAHLDQALNTFANVVEQQTGVSLHAKKGAGAAGGAGGAFQAFMPGEMQQGIHVVLQAIAFHEQLNEADLILTGEGKTDVQTLSGKTPFGIAEMARKEGKPVLLISGMVDQESRAALQPYFTEIHEISDGIRSVDDLMKNATYYLQQKTKEVLEQYLTS